MFKKESNLSSKFKKGDLGHKLLGHFHTKGSVYPMINANDTDLSESRKAGNCLEKSSK